MINVRQAKSKLATCSKSMPYFNISQKKTENWDMISAMLDDVVDVASLMTDVITFSHVRYAVAVLRCDATGCI